MSEHAPPRHDHIVPGPVTLDDEHDVGEEALHFTRWFLRSKYRLMGEFFGELQRAPDPVRIRERYCRALQHGERTLRARMIVNVLLALGAGAAAGTAIGNVLGLGDVLARVAAVAASLTVLLVGLRLALDRYLDRVDVAATFLAIELSASARRPASPPAP